jgi:hypothetical protein
MECSLVALQANATRRLYQMEVAYASHQGETEDAGRVKKKVEP